MLGAPMVFLQTQRRAGLDDDALDLEAVAHVDGIVVSPRAVHLAMKDVFLAPGFLDEIDNFLYILYTVLASNERRIWRIDNHQIFHADRCDHPAVGSAHQAIACVNGQHIAFVTVSLFVALGGSPER